ncbi:hypothetical protein FKW77_001696 [Venturia effusa]|uniref:endo-polygalacturonase n=1 Tax=Venturia effusa TaxID=50376 RepID=A0A517L8N3_9PEZI|nr:hypothetical protein FKW77_001696 [Venturia effusa]
MLQHLSIFFSTFAIADALWNHAVIPVPLAAPLAAPSSRHAVVKRETGTCIFSGAQGYLSANGSKPDCSTIVLSDMTVPGGTTLNLSQLNDGTTVSPKFFIQEIYTDVLIEVIFRGNITFGYSEWLGPLFSVSGNKIVVKGEPGSFLDGQGALYWDGKGGAGGKLKPKFFKAHFLNDSILDSITLLNSPKNSFSLDHINNLTVINITIDGRAGDALGKNSDGFNVNNANGLLITGAKVWNQDDCYAMNSGSNIVFENGFCSGGHGLSVGSFGLIMNSTGISMNSTGLPSNATGPVKPPVISNVTFRDCVMEKSQQSIRIKTNANAIGAVTNITYRNIAISGGTSYGIVVDQAYNGVHGHPTDWVNVTNFVLQNVTGTVLPRAVNVLVECGVGTCRDWKWEGVNITGGKRAMNTTRPCQNVPQGVSC